MAITPHFFNKREPESTAVRPTAPLHTASSVSTAHSPAPVPRATSAAVPVEGRSKLTVGPNIKLKGVEITDCDTLVVEGLVEATMDSRLMQIAQQGAFKGSANIDIAEIHGQFNGDLTVRDKLTVFATGKVNGKVRYSKVVIEEGGQISGDVQFGGATPPSKLVGVEMSGEFVPG